jgi:hypothetical protein
MRSGTDSTYETAHTFFSIVEYYCQLPVTKNSSLLKLLFGFVQSKIILYFLYISRLLFFLKETKVGL